MDTCKVIRLENGRLVPVLPTGDIIPGISRGSIKYFQDDDFKGAGLVTVRIDLIIYEKDIEGGYPLSEQPNKAARLGLSKDDLFKAAQFMVSLQRQSKEIDHSKVDWSTLEDDWFDFLEEKINEVAPCPPTNK